MKTKILLLILSVCLSSFLFPVLSDAQVKLTKEEEAELSFHIKNKIDEFQDYLGVIASGKTTVEVKDRAIKSALEMFIYKGEPYYDVAGIKNTGVKMQTSGSNGVVKSQLMKTYLNRLKGMVGGRYSDIVIEASDAVKVGNIYPANDGTGRYVSTAQIFQHFCGYSESGYKVYEDYTRKTVKIYIEKQTMMTPNGEIATFIVQLGDMAVKETWH